jgi:colanic acid/amylovoran biosynthesis glycosyltransferase
MHLKRQTPRGRDGALRLAYMITGYPYPSHTFIQNEVRALRALGVDVTTFVHRAATADEILSPADREAHDTTRPLRPFRLGRYLRAHIGALVTNPGGYRRGLSEAIRMRREGPQGLVWQLFYFGQAIVLWHHCRRAGLRHIHAHFANVGADVTLLAATVGGPSWSWSFTMHGPTELYDVSWFRLASKVQSAAFVVCISDFARSQLMGLVGAEHWEKLTVVHCGVDTQALAPRTVGGTPADRPFGVLCVGRLVPVKGQLVLLEAIAEIVRSGHDVKLTLVGAGEMRDALAGASRRLGIETRVELTGPLGHPDVLHRIRTADVFCLPSFAEGVPIVLMEAMALGVPVVTTRVMGIPELVEDGVSGLVVSPGTFEALVDAMRRLIDDPGLRHSLGAAGRKRVESDYALATSAEQLRALFEKQLAPG